MPAETSNLETCIYVAYDCISEYIELYRTLRGPINWKQPQDFEYQRSVNVELLGFEVSRNYCSNERVQVLEMLESAELENNTDWTQDANTNRRCVTSQKSEDLI
jgi:hypothetical protein